MASRTDAVLAKIVERLQLPEDLDPIPEGLAELAIDRFPLRMPTKGVKIRVHPFDEKVEAVGVQLVRHELLVKLDLFVSPIPEELSPDEALDPLYVWCIQRLLSDRGRGNSGALDGLADWLEERGRGWGGDEKEEAWARTVLDVAVIYRTRADDPAKRT